MHKQITVSVMPTYQCNGNCPFCYLGSSIKQKQLLDINTLQHCLWSIKKRYQCRLNVEIFGGEITLLGYSYIKQLLDKCSEYSDTDVGIVTNLTNVDIVKRLIDQGYPIAVSWNKERGKIGNLAIDNLQSLSIEYSRQINLLIVCLPSILKQKPKDLLKQIDDLNIKSVSILQYYPAIASKKHYNVSNADYQNYMIELIKQFNSHQYNFSLTNLEQWKMRYDCKQSSNIFIAPTGKFAVTMYNDDSYEYFYYFDDLSEYDKICAHELSKYITKCIKCSLFNNCLAEHLRFDQQTVCCGLPDLTEYVKSL